jgi:hypothetical protein
MPGKAMIALRLGAALGGGYALTGVAILVAARLLAHAGVQASEAVVVAAMAGFPLYLGLLLWGLACASVLRLWVWTLAWTGALGSAYWMVH